MRLLSGLFLAFLLGCSSTPKSSHAPTAGPKFLDIQIYSTLKQVLPPPPLKDSAAQKEDEKELFKLQKSRSTVDCDRAASEIDATFSEFYGPPLGPLTSSQVAKLGDFFSDVRRETGSFIGRLKSEYPRPRPYVYIEGLSPCIKREASDSYPSGHAILAEVFALILIDLFPSDKSKIEARSEMIGKDRVLAGVHHPSDISSGRAVGQQIFTELRKSEKFQTAFQNEKTILSRP